MGYKALYRTWRPQQFSDVIGQIHVSKTLRNALLNEQVAHAYLFCGPRGTGKTSTAKILAKAMNCLELEAGEPCNHCANCQSINEGNFLDVFEIDAASNRGIDEIREIRDKVKFAPSQGKCKVYIIDEVHMLTTEAFNALLKTLEEPPSHVLFILATTEVQKIPLTILSRCQRFDFRKIVKKDIKEHLEIILDEEGIKVSPSALDTIAKKADGGMRDALSVLDQCLAFSGGDIEDSHVEAVLGTLSSEQIMKITDAILKSDASSALYSLNDYIQTGKDIKQIIRDLIEHYRTMLLLKISRDENLVDLNPESLEEIKAQMENVSLNYLGEVVLKLTEIEKEIRWTSQPQILLEAGLIEIMLKSKRPLVPELEKFPEKRTIENPLEKTIERPMARPVEKVLRKDSLEEKSPQESITSLREKARELEEENRQIDEVLLENKAETKEKDFSEKEEMSLSQDLEEAQEDKSLKEGQEVAIKKASPSQKLSLSQPKELKIIKDNWEDILELVRRKKVTTHAFLLMGKPISLGEDSLEIIFERNYKFHKNKISEPDNRRIVEDAIFEQTNIRVQLQCLLEGMNQKAEHRSIAVEKALELFGSDIVEIED